MKQFFDYWRVNQYNALRDPSQIHANDNLLSGMISRYLLQRTMSVYKWELPESINQRYFEYTLFLNGYIAVFYDDKFGVVAQRCGFKNYDLYYQPKQITVANSKFFRKPIVRTINVDASLFTLEEDYAGIGDLISFYTGLLCELWESLMLNVKNSHLSYLFGCENKNQANSMKAIFDDVASGKPAVFFDKSLRDPMTGNLNVEMFNNNLSSNYIVDKILSDIKTVIQMYDSEIGIPNSSEKRERMIADEVNQNNVETFTRSEMWLTRLQENCKEVNNMFGVNMSVDFRYNPMIIEGKNKTNESEVNKNDESIS